MLNNDNNKGFYMEYFSSMKVDYITQLVGENVKGTVFWNTNLKSKHPHTVMLDIKIQLICTTCKMKSRCDIPCCNICHVFGKCEIRLG